MNRSKTTLLIGTLVLLLSAVLSAQEIGVGMTKRPGDQVRLTIIFKSPIELTSVWFRFTNQGPVQHNQPNFGTVVDGSQLSRISQTEYDVVGTVPNNVSSGTYELVNLTAGDSRGSRTYQPGKDFPSGITMRVENNAHIEFPDIKTITLAPEKK